MNLPHLQPAGTWALCLALAVLSIPAVGAPSLVALGMRVPGFGQPGHAGLAVADFDRDGLDDLVIPGVNREALFQVFGHGPGGIVSKQAVFLPDQGIAHVAAVVSGGQPQLVTASPAGTVRRFTGWPLAETGSFEVDEFREIDMAAAADLDGDGLIEVLVVTAGVHPDLSVYSLEYGTRRWSIKHMERTHGVLLAQLDGDAALEIVLASLPGLVVDGATQAIDWSYPDGFGWPMADARSHAAGSHQFLAFSLGITMFQGAPWGPGWTLPDSIPSTLATHDLDGDGFDDIIKGRSDDSDLQIIDGRTREVRLTVTGTDFPQAQALAWDHDGDGQAGVAFTRFDPSHAADELVRVVHADNGSTLWSLRNDQPMSYQRLAMARTANGLRLVYPTGSWGYNGSWVEIDAVDGHQHWQSPLGVDFDDPFRIRAERVEYTRSTPHARQLLLAGDAQGGTYSARIISLDADTHAVQWVLDESVVPAFSGFGFEDFETFDLNGFPTMAACVSGDAGARLFLINAPTGVPLWNSAPMADGEFFCEVVAGTFSDGAGPLVVAAVRSSLYAYDPLTRELAWTLPGDTGGVSFIEHGVIGREFVVFNGTALRFHDAATRDLVRSLDLGQSITAVQAVDGNVRHLIVAANGRLMVVDGVTGDVLQATDYLGSGLGAGNHIPMVDLGNGHTLIGVGSDGGVFRFRLYTGEGIFSDGFEPALD